MYYYVNFHSLCTYGFRTEIYLLESRLWLTPLNPEADKYIHYLLLTDEGIRSQLTKLSGIFELVVLHFIYRSGHC